MSKQQDALRLALEALVKSVDNFPANRLHRHAIWAVREALDEDSSGTEQPAQQDQQEFPLRGILASELKCWHRLTEDEAQNLLAFVQNMPSKPAQPQQEPVLKVVPKMRGVLTVWFDGEWHRSLNKSGDGREVALYTSPPASNQCKFPLCQNEDYQQALAEQIKQELYTGEPAQRKPLTDEQIMAIGKELGLKCRLGGNPSIDFDYARAIEVAHGIKG